MNEVPDIRAAEAAFASRDPVALARETALLYPGDPDFQYLGDLACLALGMPVPGFDPPGTATVFLDNIAATDRLIESGQLTQCHQDRLRIGEDLDFIGNLQGIEDWTIPQFLNFLSMGRIQHTRGAAVVTTMRDDGIYALEWIAYYLTLGFESLFVYTNDNSDGSEELLRILAANKVITLIESETSRRVFPEAKAFEHSVQLLRDLRAFEWVLYVDSDEFFVPAPRFGNSMTNVLSEVADRFPFGKPSAICYPWMWFVSEMAFFRTPGLLIERFQHARYHSITKSLVRLRDVVSMRCDHYPEVRRGGFLVDSALDPMPFEVRKVWEKHDPQYAGGRINHYWPKSFEEFAVKKARGSTLILEENSYDRPFELFFQWNGYRWRDNHYPMDPAFVSRVREKMDELRKIEGVGAVVDRIDLEFPAVVARYYSGQEDLRSLYSRHKTEPTEL